MLCWELVSAAKMLEMCLVRISGALGSLEEEDPLISWEEMCPWNCPGRCRQWCLLLTPPPSSGLPVGWLCSDSPCGLGSAHVPVLLARPHLSIVNHDPSGTSFSLVGSQNSNKKTSWWEVFGIKSCRCQQTRKWIHRLLSLRSQRLV